MPKRLRCSQCPHHLHSLYPAEFECISGILLENFRSWDNGLRDSWATKVYPNLLIALSIDTTWIVLRSWVGIPKQSNVSQGQINFSLIIESLHKSQHLSAFPPTRLEWCIPSHTQVKLTQIQFPFSFPFPSFSTS